MNRSESHFYPRVFALVTAALLGIALFRILQPFIGSILWSVLLAFLLFPLNRVLRRMLRGSRAAAASVLTLGVVVGLIGPVSILVVAFTRQASDLFARLQSAAGRFELLSVGDLLRLALLARVASWAESMAGITTEQIETWLATAAKTLMGAIVAMSGAFVVEALGTLVGLIVALFLLFFFLRDGEDMLRSLQALIPLDAERQAHLAAHLSAVTRAVVFGSLLVALLQGTLVGLSFALVRLPSPIVFGALAAVASLVPLFGAALVWVPGALALAFQGRWGAALFVLIWNLAVVSSADNVVRPLFISGRAQISTLPVFLGAAGGVAAFGPIGLVLGPVIVALTLALLRFAEESRRDEMAEAK
ncbi:MAG TPA: AI-2E family transporter [Methylomirabilota bacterium]|jgi:predicted PurR-regulated permease PerM|nr:AI-2E family transporter [Methylomirabilota bacterium]